MQSTDKVEVNFTLYFLNKQKIVENTLQTPQKEKKIKIKRLCPWLRK
jgi:hypothetical protein